MSEKQAFLDAWDRESATTLKVLRAYPGNKEDLKPHPTCRSAKDLAWTFVFEGVGQDDRPRSAKSGPQRPVSVRERQEVQEVSRRGRGVTSGSFSPALGGER